MSDTLTETPQITEEMKVAAAKNEWGKTFKLGDREFEIKDLTYFDYVEFVSLAKPLITVAASGIEMKNIDGELGISFDATALDFDQLMGLCGKELPRMGYLVCRQSDPKIKEAEVAMLAHRPQRLVEIVLLQILHNKMIEEFGGFFQRLTGIVTALVPSMGALTPSSETE